MSIQWEDFDSLLAAKAASMFAALNESASSRQLELAEAALGCRFPDSLRAAYLRHDGQQPDWETPFALFGSYHWLSLDRVVSAYESHSTIRDGYLEDPANAEERFLFVQEEDALQPTQAVRYDLWNARWIPFAADNTGTSLVVDMAPGPAGQAGQVFLWEAVDRASQDVVARSFGALVESLASALKGGRIRCSEQVDLLGWVDAASGAKLSQIPSTL